MSTTKYERGHLTKSDFYHYEEGGDLYGTLTAKDQKKLKEAEGKDYSKRYEAVDKAMQHRNADHTQAIDNNKLYDIPKHNQEQYQSRIFNSKGETIIYDDGPRFHELKKEDQDTIRAAYKTYNDLYVKKVNTSAEDMLNHNIARDDAFLAFEAAVNQGVANIDRRTQADFDSHGVDGSEFGQLEVPDQDKVRFAHDRKTRYESLYGKDDQQTQYASAEYNAAIEIGMNNAKIKPDPEPLPAPCNTGK